MTPRRTLPVGLTSQPGEVLESWLGTLAMLQDTTFGQFLRHISSSIDGVDLRRAGLSVYLTEQELAAISVSTGLEPEIVVVHCVGWVKCRFAFAIRRRRTC